MRKRQYALSRMFILTLLNGMIMKKYMYLAFAIALVMNSSMAQASKSAKAVTNPIPVIGKTADQKYPVYGLEGDLDDFTFYANSVAYNTGDLEKRMVYLEKGDVDKNGYQCEFICKDSKGHTVGLNPAYRNVGPVKKK